MGASSLWGTLGCSPLDCLFEILYIVLFNYVFIKLSKVVNYYVILISVPSQVVLAKHLTKNNMSVNTKIAIQINCKLGGAPWYIDIPIKKVKLSIHFVFNILLSIMRMVFYRG